MTPPAATPDAAPTLAGAPPPFDLTAARGEAGPFVFASPHSGAIRPADLNPSAALSEASLRSAEDVLVDRLIEGGPDHGAPVIAGRISRAYVDLNRDPAELDPALIDGVAPEEVSAKTAAGFGVIPRRSGDGLPLHDRRISLTQARWRLAAVHAPYHAALAGLMGEAQARHGTAILIDWHSMPSRAAGGRVAGVAGRAVRGLDVVLGDRYGSSCDARLTRRLRALFEGLGWRVGLNQPYAGGYSTQTWGRPDEGFHAIQIELNRGLYLNETTLEPSADFNRCRTAIQRVIAAVCAETWPGKA
ncbi:MAG: N-formylglutamate amidohydrolase [Brevundimonas sp.]|nr:N-formylglutamate amidohydrolase [Brevundimonas sp.]